MPMPNRRTVGGEAYRYAFQGQEKDPETGKEAFELRLWDSRIGRWLSPDPYGQFHSPYNGMGNDPINGIDPNGGYKTWFGAFFGWVGGGFEGKIGHPGGEGNKDWSVFKAKSLGEYNFDTHTFGEVLLYNDYGKNNSLWDSRARRFITGDMLQFSVGWNASIFAGGGTTLEFNWLLTGKDASFFPYIGYSAHGTVSDGGNLSVDFGFNKAFHSGPVNSVSAASLPGWEFGGSVGGKIIVGADVGYSYSPDGDYGWHQINTSVGVGLELSPITAANVQLQAEYNFVQVHTGTGKWYFNE
jgi:RHS repeat-associated protein